MQTRPIKTLLAAKPVLEGAGVHLKRAFGYYEVPQFDPFLLMDDFRNEDPSKYIKGFPWHPHRGIETITYMLEGFAEHGDSMGNKGTIGPGDVQWMTAGSGIIHQEMPKPGADGRMYGFQLWANLPASHKMMKPRYQDVKASEIPEIILDNSVKLRVLRGENNTAEIPEISPDNSVKLRVLRGENNTAEIPEISPDNSVKLRVLCGEIYGVKGPVKDIIIDPEYLDITVPAGAEYFHPTKRGYTVFVYVIGGSMEAGGWEDRKTGRREDGKTAGEIGNGTLALFDDGDQVFIRPAGAFVRLLLISGKPLNEPVAWGGPIVMNTKEELNLAFEEFRSGNFIK